MQTRTDAAHMNQKEAHAIYIYQLVTYRGLHVVQCNPYFYRNSLW